MMKYSSLLNRDCPLQNYHCFIAIIIFMLQLLFSYAWNIYWQGEEFPGLLPLISSYLNTVEVDADTHCTIHQYLRLIQKRADGELMTAAHWIRQFVSSHPDYKYSLLFASPFPMFLLTLNLTLFQTWFCCQRNNQLRSVKHNGKNSKRQYWLSFIAGPF